MTINISTIKSIKMLKRATSFKKDEKYYSFLYAYFSFSLKTDLQLARIHYSLVQEDALSVHIYQS